MATVQPALAWGNPQTQLHVVTRPEGSLEIVLRLHCLEVVQQGSDQCAVSHGDGTAGDGTIQWPRTLRWGPHLRSDGRQLCVGTVHGRKMPSDPQANVLWKWDIWPEQVVARRYGSRQFGRSVFCFCCRLQQRR